LNEFANREIGVPWELRFEFLARHTRLTNDCCKGAGFDFPVIGNRNGNGAALRAHLHDNMAATLPDNYKSM
jgi:hypothetical protein